MAPGRDKIEIIRPAKGRKFACAIFDFDGTLSLIRRGWQDVMIPMMVEILRPLAHGLDEAALEELAREDVTSLTGEQTIYQMIRLAERVRQFGGAPADPLEYKRQYNTRLMERIDYRRRALAAGQARPADMMLRGARAMIEALGGCGLKLYLTSGTDQEYVVEEAGLLGLADCFDGGIHGARDDYKTHTKAKVVARVIRESGVAGSEVLGFGDGFVEIVAVREVGGYTVGVASDEEAGGGMADARKRRRLMEAGADLIVGDFAEGEALLAALFEAE